MKNRIEAAIKLGKVSEEIKEQHKGFSEWTSEITKRDHQTILQILIHGRDASSVDTDGNQLPTLVYLAREKRPQHSHNLKAGAINSLRLQSYTSVLETYGNHTFPPHRKILAITTEILELRVGNWLTMLRSYGTSNIFRKCKQTLMRACTKANSSIHMSFELELSFRYQLQHTFL
ncbi:hypothetical protein MKX01_036041 [Papaver californicum]|nr:hypothetical protein MKX01_036041 [Papaver californicum]